MAGAMSGDSRARFNPLMAILAPFAAMLIQFAISRQREFGADRTGAELSGRPLVLASALQKLNSTARRVPMQIAPTYAPLAQVDPLQAYGRGLLTLFSTASAGRGARRAARSDCTRNVRPRDRVACTIPATTFPQVLDPRLARADPLPGQPGVGGAQAGRPIGGRFAAADRAAPTLHPDVDEARNLLV